MSLSSMKRRGDRRECLWCNLLLPFTVLHQKKKLCAGRLLRQSFALPRNDMTGYMMHNSKRFSFGQNRVYLKTGTMTNGEGFFRCVSHFSQEYLVYFKETGVRTAGKVPPLGHADGFQIDPKKFSQEIIRDSIPGILIHAPNRKIQSNHKPFPGIAYRGGAQ